MLCLSSFNSYWITCSAFLVDFRSCSSSKTIRGLSCSSNRSFAEYSYWMVIQETTKHSVNKLTDVSIHEGPILNAFGVVRMHFETAGSAPFILTGVKLVQNSEISFSNNEILFTACNDCSKFSDR